MKKNVTIFMILSMIFTLSACVGADNVASNRNRLINDLEASDNSEHTEDATADESQNTESERTEAESTEATESETADTETDAAAEDSNNAVDPDLKAFLDEYEAFMNDYIDFMVKYQNSDDTMSMISDYAEIMKDYVYYVEAVDKYEPDEMSAADAAYYIDVTARIFKKLVSASLD